MLVGRVVQLSRNAFAVPARAIPADVQLVLLVGLTGLLVLGAFVDAWRKSRTMTQGLAEWLADRELARRESAAADETGEVG